MTRIQVEHETRYDYQTAVELAHHLAYLRPLTSPWQELLITQLSIDPAPDSQSNNLDAFGNTRTFFTFVTPHTTLVVQSLSIVNITDRYAGASLDQTPAWEQVAASLHYARNRPFLQAEAFVFPSPYLPRLEPLKQYAAISFTPGRPMAQACLDLCDRIHKDFTYSPNATNVNTPVLEAFNKRAGVCQDFSHIYIACLRALGLSAQYVSGYLVTKPPPGKTKLRGADASHAWVSVYCPGVPGDWLELDPTNNVIPSDQHIRLAIGRDFGDVSPVRGVIRGGGDHLLKIAVTCETL